MRRVAGRITMALLAAGCASVSAQDRDLPPLPSHLCPDPVSSDPAASYRVSEQCELADITVLGAYTAGTGDVLEEVRGFRTQSVELATVDGKSIYFREVRIELHRLLEPTAILVCRLEMLRPVVVEARIERNVKQPNGRTGTVINALPVSGGRLPDVGVYTHGKNLPDTPCAVGEIIDPLDRDPR